jgi:hypothetical protein
MGETIQFLANNKVLGLAPLVAGYTLAALAGRLVAVWLYDRVAGREQAE